MDHGVVESPTAATRAAAGLLTAVSAFLYVTLRVVNANDYSFWADEVFSIGVAGQGWGQILETIRNDVVHPPLYYLILKAWRDVGGSSELYLRFLSVAAATLALVPLTRAAMMVGGGARSVLLLILLAGFNVYLIEYADQVRPYAFAFLWSAWSTKLFLELLLARKWSLSLGLRTSLCNLLLLYTHFFGALLLAAQGLALLYSQRSLVLGWFGSAAVVGLGLIPWLAYVYPALAAQNGIQGISWIEPPVWQDLFRFFETLTGHWDVPGSTALSLLVFAVPIAWFCLGSRVQARDEVASSISVGVELAICLAFPVLAAFGATLLLPETPPWQPRYLIICAPAFLVLYSAAIAQVSRRSLAIGMAAVGVAWVSGSYIAAPPARESHPDFRTLVREYVAAPVHSDLVAISWFVALPLDYYVGNTGAVLRSIPAEARNGGATFWLALRAPPGEVERKSRELMGGGCRVELRARTRGPDYEIGLSRVTCALVPTG